LTFDEALANAESGDNDPDAEVKSKVPDQCCPAICGKMQVLPGFFKCHPIPRGQCYDLVNIFSEKRKKMAFLTQNTAAVYAENGANHCFKEDAIFFAEKITENNYLNTDPLLGVDLTTMLMTSFFCCHLSDSQSTSLVGLNQTDMAFCFMPGAA
jgi:hypothetical protein